MIFENKGKLDMIKSFTLLSFAGVVMLIGSGCQAFAGNGSWQPGQEVRIDDGWRFQKGEVPNGQQPYYDDSSWAVVDLPHDWSLDDLPPREVDSRTTISVTDGVWRFTKGDDMAWKAVSFDDSGWEKVELPNNWEEHSDYRDDQVYGWYRRTIPARDPIRSETVLLEVGVIDDVDETFVNGKKVGQTGSFPPDFVSKNNVKRIYEIPVSLLKNDGTDVIAIRVYDDRGRGGLYNKVFPNVVSGPFDSEAVNGRFSGFTVGGIGWYRKHFNVPESWEGKRVVVRFGGVYMNADFWINGVHLGNHPYGYTSFHYDLTRYLKTGEENILAVEVKNLGENTRWYSGSGIYRHVDLLVTEPVHIGHWGVYVTTQEVSVETAEVQIETRIVKPDDAAAPLTLETRIVDPRDRPAGKIVSEADELKGDRFIQTLHLRHPRLWSPDRPHLYKAVSELKYGDVVLDEKTTTFGIRSIEFSAQSGFILNGKPMLLRGGCMHHDNGPLGAAAFDEAEERRVQLMKDSGFNAIRTAHNPPSVAFLDACDRLGMLVIDEAFDVWNRSKKKDDYSNYFKDWWKRDLESMIYRDRNHPSIIMWSTGNEIPERQTPLGFETSEMLADYVRKLDPTRPVTSGVNGVNPKKDPFMEPLDVVGYNYALKWNEGHKYKVNCYVGDHERKPERVIYGSESFALKAFDYWKAAEDYSWVIGDFVWTGYDYLGEAGIGWWGFSGNYLWTLAYCGDINICGWKRPQSYYRDAFWGEEPMVSVFVTSPEPTFAARHGWDWTWHDVWPCWNWPGQAGKDMNVEVYSNCEEVTLTLNGRELGTRKDLSKSNFMSRFRVPYEPGTLKAVGYNDGEKAAEWELVTAGKPAKIRLLPEERVILADNQGLCYVTVEITDDEGNLVANADNLVEFEIEGPARLAAVCNSKPNSLESFRQPRRHAFMGRCQVILRSTHTPGKITLKATTEGLEPAQVNIQAR